VKQLEPCLRLRDECLEDLARGAPRGRRKGQPYAASTIYEKRQLLARREAEIEALIPKIEALTAVEIPSYRVWCAIAGGRLPAKPGASSGPDPAAALEAWHRWAMRREARLAEQEGELAVQRHRLHRDLEAFEERQRAEVAQMEGDRAALATERARLRDDVVAGVQRDHAELLREVGELEARRRGALAVVAGSWPGGRDQVIGTAAAERLVAERTGEQGDELLARARALGWRGQNELARRAGKTPGHVSRVPARPGKGGPTWAALERVVMKAERRGEGGPELAIRRKAALMASGRTYADLARLAGLSYSMVDKWMNARRASRTIQNAFNTLTRGRA
jgi:hypothetical protein